MYSHIKQTTLQCHRRTQWGPGQGIWGTEVPQWGTPVCSVTRVNKICANLTPLSFYVVHTVRTNGACLDAQTETKALANSK